MAVGISFLVPPTGLECRSVRHLTCGVIQQQHCTWFCLIINPRKLLSDLLQLFIVFIEICIKGAIELVTCQNFCSKQLGNSQSTE